MGVGSTDLHASSFFPESIATLADYNNLLPQLNQTNYSATQPSTPSKQRSPYLERSNSVAQICNPCYRDGSDSVVREIASTLHPCASCPNPLALPELDPQFETFLSSSLSKLDVSPVLPEESMTAVEAVTSKPATATALPEISSTSSRGGKAAAINAVGNILPPPALALVSSALLASGGNLPSILPCAANTANTSSAGISGHTPDVAAALTAGVAASKLGLADQLKTALNSVENLVSLRDAEGRTCLHYAAGYGHEDCVDLLLSKSSDARAQDCHGDVPLHFAAIHGHPMCAYNIGKASCGACLIKNKRGQTPIDVAVACERGEVLNAMLLACAGDASEVAVRAMRKLLKDGAVPDTWAPNGSSALMLAASVDGTPALQVLLAAGASIELQDALGRSALMFAAGNCAQSALVTLLDAGACMSLRDRRGRSVLDYAPEGSQVRSTLQERLRALEEVAQQLQDDLLASLESGNNSSQKGAGSGKSNAGSTSTSKKGKNAKKSANGSSGSLTATETMPAVQPAKTTAIDTEARESGIVSVPTMPQADVVDVVEVGVEPVAKLSGSLIAAANASTSGPEDDNHLATSVDSMSDWQVVETRHHKRGCPATLLISQPIAKSVASNKQAVLQATQGVHAFKAVASSVAGKQVEKSRIAGSASSTVSVPTRTGTDSMARQGSGHSLSSLGSCDSHSLSHISSSSSQSRQSHAVSVLSHSTGGSQTSSGAITASTVTAAHATTPAVPTTTAIAATAPISVPIQLPVNAWTARKLATVAATANSLANQPQQAVHTTPALNPSVVSAPAVNSTAKSWANTVGGLTAKAAVAKSNGAAASGESNNRQPQAGSVQQTPAVAAASNALAPSMRDVVAKSKNPPNSSSAVVASPPATTRKRNNNNSSRGTSPAPPSARGSRATSPARTPKQTPSKSQSRAASPTPTVGRARASLDVDSNGRPTVARNVAKQPEISIKPHKSWQVPLAATNNVGLQKAQIEAGSQAHITPATCSIGVQTVLAEKASDDALMAERDALLGERNKLVFERDALAARVKELEKQLKQQKQQNSADKKSAATSVSEDKADKQDTGCNSKPEVAAAKEAAQKASVDQAVYAERLRIVMHLLSVGMTPDALITLLAPLAENGSPAGTMNSVASSMPLGSGMNVNLDCQPQAEHKQDPLADVLLLNNQQDSSLCTVLKTPSDHVVVNEPPVVTPVAGLLSAKLSSLQSMPQQQNAVTTAGGAHPSIAAGAVSAVACTAAEAAAAVRAAKERNNGVETAQSKPAPRTAAEAAAAHSAMMKLTRQQQAQAATQDLVDSQVVERISQICRASPVDVTSGQMFPQASEGGTTYNVSNLLSRPSPPAMSNIAGLPEPTQQCRLPVGDARSELERLPTLAIPSYAVNTALGIAGGDVLPECGDISAALALSDDEDDTLLSDFAAVLAKEGLAPFKHSSAARPLTAPSRDNSNDGSHSYILPRRSFDPECSSMADIGNLSAVFAFPSLTTVAGSHGTTMPVNIDYSGNPSGSTALKDPIKAYLQYQPDASLPTCFDNIWSRSPADPPCLVNMRSAKSATNTGFGMAVNEQQACLASIQAEFSSMPASPSGKSNELDAPNGGIFANLQAALQPSSIAKTASQNRSSTPTIWVNNASNDTGYNAPRASIKGFASDAGIATNGDESAEQVTALISHVHNCGMPAVNDSQNGTEDKLSAVSTAAIKVPLARCISGALSTKDVEVPLSLVRGSQACRSGVASPFGTSPMPPYDDMSGSSMIEKVLGLSNPATAAKRPTDCTDSPTRRIAMFQADADPLSSIRNDFANAAAAVRVQRKSFCGGEDLSSLVEGTNTLGNPVLSSSYTGASNMHSLAATSYLPSRLSMQSDVYNARGMTSLGETATNQATWRGSAAVQTSYGFETSANAGQQQVSAPRQGHLPAAQAAHKAARILSFSAQQQRITLPDRL